MSTDANARQEWRAGWLLAVSCLAGMTIGSVMMYSLGAFVVPLEEEFGWSRAQITLGLTVTTLSGAVLAPFAGALLDRWGPRRIALPGALVALATIAMLAFATESFALWLGLWFLLSVGAIGVTPTIWTMAVASNFQKARGLAIAVAFCGSSVSAIIMPILATWLIDTYGWRAAFPMISGIVAVVLWPVLFFGLRSKADEAVKPGLRGAAKQSAPAGPGVLNLRDAIFSPQFIKLALAAFLFTAAGIGLVSNLIPVMSSMEFSRAQAAGIAGLLGVASFTGRLITGYLIDRFDSNMIAGALVSFPVFSCMILLNAQGDPLLAAVAVVILGLSLGAEVDVIAYLAAEKFGTARYGTIFGFIASSWYLATAIGPVLISLVYDLTGTYNLALYVAMPLFALVSLLLFTLGKPLPFDEPARA